MSRSSQAAPRSAAAIEEQAALWLVRCDEPEWSDDDAAMLEAWLNSSMANRAAFWRLRHGWKAADRVTALGTAPQPTQRGRPGFSELLDSVRRVPVSILSSVAAAIVVMLSAGVWFVYSMSSPSVEATAVAYRTPIGKQRLLKLADGSQVELNTATTLRAAVQSDTREVWLDTGEAYFNVAHRAGEQFVVHAGPRTITVLGTRFIVRREGERVTVAVLSGRVKVDDAIALPRRQRRSAVVATGDIAVAEPRATLIATDSAAQVAAIAAWRDGMIVLDDTPVSDVVTEFNRYSTRPIRIVDPAVAQLRVGGSFRIGESRSFLELMRRAYHVQVHDDGNEITLTR